MLNIQYYLINEKDQFGKEVNFILSFPREGT